MTKIVKISIIKIVAKFLDEEHFIAILKSIKPVVNKLLKFRPTLSDINIPGYDIAKCLIPTQEPLFHIELRRPG